MDIKILLFLQSLRISAGGVFNQFFLSITTLGEDHVLMLWVAAFCWCVEKETGIFMLFNFHMGNFVNQFMKITACVYRPWVRDSRIAPVEAAKTAATGYSFPSGHTAKAAAVWGGLAVKKKGCRPLRKFLCLIVVAVAFSRNYLGVHTPQDVVVSLLLGYLLLKVSGYLMQWTEGAGNRDIWVGLAGLLLAAGLLIYAANKNYPMDYVDGVLLVNPASMVHGAVRGAGGMCGFMLGWLWERRLIRFREQEGTLDEKLIRFLIGAMGLLVVMRLSPQLIGKMGIGQAGIFFNGFLVPFYIIGIYPWFLTKGMKQRLRID